MQLYELHRLYQIQKMLMNNVKSSTGPARYGSNRWNVENDNNVSRVNYSRKEQQKPRRRLDLEQPAAEDCNVDESGGGDGVLEKEDESDIELTLGPTVYNLRKKDEAPLTSDSGPSFSSSSTESSHMKRTNTGTQNGIYTTEELTGHKWGLVQLPDTHSSFQSQRKNTFGVEEHMRQEKLNMNRPPWLYHVFSLNLT
uniref:Uncharacterized protein n=1 Tax=Nelumbo nucifera TaxID=4432 RepID=A0A822XQX1_NELNU|nr:TPA_asm: hypothetical protein HUJ06_022819 [Nelumbo nucifera]